MYEKFITGLVCLLVPKFGVRQALEERALLSEEDRKEVGAKIKAVCLKRYDRIDKQLDRDVVFDFILHCTKCVVFPAGAVILLNYLAKL